MSKENDLIKRGDILKEFDEKRVMGWVRDVVENAAPRCKMPRKVQKAVSEILCQFQFTRNMDEVFETWERIFRDYSLCLDPFTNTPCTPDEYEKATLEYHRQIMMEKYGYID